MEYYELEPEENHFYSVVADITHRCNMNCKNCYIPNRQIEDMSADKLIECIKRFPKRCELRLIGAEPTMRPDLPELIQRIRDAGHRPAMMTNGLKLDDYDYCVQLKEAGLATVNISMNGGTNDELYKKIDGQYCLERKLQALKNCHKAGMFININTIVMRGVNDEVAKDLHNLMIELEVNNAVLRFRNVAQLGRHTLKHEENYTFDELIDLIGGQLGKDPEYIKQHCTINGYHEERTVLFPLSEGKKYKTIQVKITDWSPAPDVIPDPGSKRRGRITQDFKVAPFFEHVKKNEFYY